MSESLNFRGENETSEPQTPARRWRRSFTWLTLLALGWVLYELTTQPTLGAVAVCLKFGWEDFRAAIWLRRVDPRRLRGRSCFWLCLASGLAKTAGVAGLMSFAFVVVSPKGPAAQGPRWAAIMEMAAWTGLTTLVGLICTALTFVYAAALARYGGFKLWLSRDIHRARRRNDWPPYRTTIVQNNRLNFLLLCALLVVFLPPVLFCILIVPIIGLPLLVGFGAPIATTLLALLTMAVPVFALHCKDYVGRWHGLRIKTQLNY